jgi:N-acetyl-anhydromuramyl-L-alanine amidase AmpD
MGHAIDLWCQFRVRPMKKMILLSLAVLSSTIALASDITDFPSENCALRNPAVKLDHLVIHCVGMTEEWVLQNFSQSSDHGGMGVSANYYIPPAGDKTYRMVSDDKTSYHAGISEWHGRAVEQGLKGLNHMSLGIEVGCKNYGHVDGQTYFPYSFQPYSDSAIQRGITLSQRIVKEFGIQPENVVWHSDISPWRTDNTGVILGKTDPGATFPGKQFAEIGIGVWPEEDRVQDSQLKLDRDSLKLHLLKIGFSFDPKDELQSNYAVQAFIMHYVPNAIIWDKYASQTLGPLWDGNVTEDMMIRAENLAMKSYFNK